MPPLKTNKSMENPPFEDLLYVLVKMGCSNVIVSMHGCKFLNVCPEKMLPPRFEMVALKGNFDQSNCASFFCPKVELISTWPMAKL